MTRPNAGMGVPVKPPRTGWSRERVKLLLIAVPFLIYIFMFSYVPLAGWAISFSKYYPGIPLDKLEFIGLANFRMFFSDWRQVSAAVINTFAMSGLMLLSYPLPAIFAIMLYELRSKKLRKMTQTVSTIPYFISYVLMYLAFVSLFSPSDGMLNKLLFEQLHLIDRPMTPLTNPDIAWWMQTFVYLFKTAGYSAILYLSAIASIDPQLFDAAEIDGANRFQCVLHVIVPGITSTFVVLLVLGIGNMLSGAGFEQYYVFGNGLVLDKLEVIDTYTYKMGIVQSNYSFGTAMSMMKSLFSVTMLLTANAIVKRVRGSSIF